MLKINIDGPFIFAALKSQQLKLNDENRQPENSPVLESASSNKTKGNIKSLQSVTTSLNIIFNLIKLFVKLSYIIRFFFQGVV